MIDLFCGYDAREAVGYEVFIASAGEHSSEQLVVRRLDNLNLPQGSNAFTFSRFLVPYLMSFKGVAIYVDASDMMMLDDLSELAALYDPTKAVQCVKHMYRTRNARKYIGTGMECANRDYPRKNWASLMLINCAHASWSMVTPEWVAYMSEAPTILLGLGWLGDENIGELPERWNVLADEGQSLENAALLHWTTGIPEFEHYRRAPGAKLWRAQKRKLQL